MEIALLFDWRLSIVPKNPHSEGQELVFRTGFRGFRNWRLKHRSGTEEVQDSIEAGGGDAMSMNWGTIRIILGTLGGGALGFYVMHNVENNYKVGSFYVFFQCFTCHRGFR